MKNFLLHHKAVLGFLLICPLVLAIYFPTLQTIVNGSSDDLMNDTGEIQVALNVWGTLHATGYPLYAILGNLFVAAARALGVAPAAAPALFALLCGILALGLVYALAVQLTARPELAAGVTLLFALTRDAWINNVIAEVYSFALAFQVLLLLVALWPREVRHRLEWLAFIGGLGIAHHRGLILSIPPIVYTVYPQLKIEVRQDPRKILLWLFLGLLGFVPYIYLPLRVWMHASWVYGEPGTLAGFWDQFSARESPNIVSLPASLDALTSQFNSTNDLLIQELTAVGFWAGVLGLVLAVRNPQRRRVGITFFISATVAYAFMVFLFTDILAPVVLHITLSLAFGWLFLGEALWMWQPTARVAGIGLAVMSLLLAGFLITQNFNSIYSLTHDASGVEAIRMARGVPAGSALVLEWGTRYYAVAFAQEVLGELGQFRRADDKADLSALDAQSPILTFDYAMYDLGTGWWQKKLGHRVYLRAAGPHLVQIDRAPKLLPPNAARPADEGLGVAVLDRSADCANDAVVVQVDWVALRKPAQDLSVFVHLLDRDGSLIAQSDQEAPVYGWRPLTTWEPREIVHDVYALANLSNGAKVEFGLYGKLADGQFRNYATFDLALLCK